MYIDSCTCYMLLFIVAIGNFHSPKVETSLLIQPYKGITKLMIGISGIGISGISISICQYQAMDYPVVYSIFAVEFSDCCPLCLDEIKKL